MWHHSQSLQVTLEPNTSFPVDFYMQKLLKLLCWISYKTFTPFRKRSSIHPKSGTVCVIFPSAWIVRKHLMWDIKPDGSKSCKLFGRKQTKKNATCTPPFCFVFSFLHWGTCKFGSSFMSLDSITVQTTFSIIWSLCIWPDLLRAGTFSAGCCKILHRKILVCDLKLENSPVAINGSCLFVRWAPA